ncbi:MAG: hypothetical protein HUU23_04460 [Caldilineales bacterium]|nr:hypothetical protein [Caldilineales bacterium]
MPVGPDRAESVWIKKPRGRLHSPEARAAMPAFRARRQPAFARVVDDGL